MSAGISNSQVLYQTLYPSTDLPYLMPRHFPLLHLIKRVGGLSGDVLDLPWLYGPKQGYSQNFTSAQAQAGGSLRGTRAALRCSQAYYVAEFLDKDLRLSQGEAAYASLFEKVMTGAIQTIYSNLDLDLHGSGYGWRGTVAVLPGGTNTITGATLAANQVQFNTAFALETVFEQDQLIDAVTFAGFTAPTGSIFPPADGRTPSTVSSPVMVTAVDPNSYTITFSDASVFVTAGVGSFACQDGGAIGFSSTNLNPAFIGLDSYNPYGGPVAGDNLCGVNRTVYPTRLAGYWYDGSRLSIEDAVKRLAARMAEGSANQGGMVSGSRVCLMNPLDMDALDSKLGSSVRYSSFTTATYGFESIRMNTAVGPLDIVADPHQARQFARIITPESWELNHNGELPELVEVGGRTEEQALNFDGRTARLRAYAQLRCTMPHMNGIVRLPTVLV